MNMHVSDTLKNACGNWPFILPSMGINVPENNKHGICPKCGGKDRFRFDDKDGRGTWFCNQCGNGDGLDLICLISGQSKTDAVAEITQVLGTVPAKKTPARKEASDAQKRVQLEKTYQSLAGQSSLGESLYLKNKGLIGHQYPLTAKPVSMAGMTFPEGSLLLPLVALDNQITGAQLISPAGDKCLLSGSKMAGAFLAVTPIPDEYPERVIITEGFATAVTVSGLSDGWCVAAVSANNLLNVAKAMRDKWPDARLVIAGDNDFADGKDNPGREKAFQAAQAVNGWVTIPSGQFKADWDDFRREFGVQRARDAFGDEMVNPNDTETRLPHGERCPMLTKYRTIQPQPVFLTA